MSPADRTIRTLVGLAIVVLIFGGELTGTAAFVLGGVAIILLVTSMLGICFLYALFGISTLKRPA
jgi:hypothetical protein